MSRPTRGRTSAKLAAAVSGRQAWWSITNTTRAPGGRAMLPAPGRASDPRPSRLAVAGLRLSEAPGDGPGSAQAPCSRDRPTIALVGHRRFPSPTAVPSRYRKATTALAMASGSGSLCGEYLTAGPHFWRPPTSFPARSVSMVPHAFPGAGVRSRRFYRRPASQKGDESPTINRMDWPRAIRHQSNW